MTASTGIGSAGGGGGGGGGSGDNPLFVMHALQVKGAPCVPLGQKVSGIIILPASSLGWLPFT